MSEDKIERILATYRPVEDMPGYVWINYGSSYVKIDVLREAYEEHFKEIGEKKDEHFEKVGEIDDGKSTHLS